MKILCEFTGPSVTSVGVYQFTKPASIYRWTGTYSTKKNEVLFFLFTVSISKGGIQRKASESCFWIRDGTITTTFECLVVTDSVWKVIGHTVLTNLKLLLCFEVVITMVA